MFDKRQNKREKEQNTHRVLCTVHLTVEHIILTCYTAGNTYTP